MLKTQGGETLTPWTAYQRNSTSCAVSVQGTGFSVTAKDYLKSVGFDTPDFHKRQRRGELLPYTRWDQFQVKGEILSYVGESSRLTWTCKTYPSYWTEGPQDATGGHFLVTEGEMETILSEMSLDAHQFVQQAAANIYSRFDLLTFLAEVHQVKALLTNFVGRFADLIRSRKVAEAWLEGRYGWRLLYYDMRAIEDLILNISDKRTRHKHRAGTTVTDSRSGYKTVTSASGTTKLHWSESIELSARGSVIVDAKLSKVQFNPAVTAWELIRFSFVIDWIVSIGAWINAMSLELASTKSAAAVGYQLSVNRVYAGSENIPSSGWNRNLQLSSTCDAVLTSRAPTSIPYRPYVRDNLDLVKITDLLALVYQALSRSRTPDRIIRKIDKIIRDVVRTRHIDTH